MVSVILHGCSGHMGQVVTDIIAAEPDVQIVAGIDAVDLHNREYPVFTKAADCQVPADVIIDFSTAKAVDVLVNYGVERNIPIVLCTTGLSEEQIANIKAASEEIAILRSANMSIGVNLLLKLLREVSGTLTESGFDPEIIEQHHRRKIDAPSGTALMIADAVKEVKTDAEYVYDRHSYRKKRDKREVGIHSVRGGNIVGEHEIIFAGQDEILKISHSARSKTVFAVGALNAAVFLKG